MLFICWNARGCFFHEAGGNNFVKFSCTHHKTNLSLFHLNLAAEERVLLIPLDFLTGTKQLSVHEARVRVLWGVVPQPCFSNAHAAAEEDHGGPDCMPNCWHWPINTARRGLFLKYPYYIFPPPAQSLPCGPNMASWLAQFRGPAG